MAVLENTKLVLYTYPHTYYYDYFIYRSTHEQQSTVHTRADSCY